MISLLRNASTKPRQHLKKPLSKGFLLYIYSNSSLLFLPGDRRRIADTYNVFACVDVRRKAAKRSNRKSKPRDEIKPRNPYGLRGFIFIICIFLHAPEDLSPIAAFLPLLAVCIPLSAFLLLLARNKPSLQFAVQYLEHLACGDLHRPLVTHE